MKTVATFVFSVALMGSAMCQQAPTLRVGDPAPPLKVSGWVKGTPVDSLAEGNLYVVEFWATWCGPCRMSIPHLTELAKRFEGKVTFIGVSSFEHNQSDYTDAVPKFVKEMGEKMEYHVATDDAPKADGTMAKTWMIAAGQGGIPTAFVVGKDGTIQWIGHPMVDLDTTLTQILAGKFDAQKVAAEKEKRDAENREFQAAMRGVPNSTDWKARVAALNNLISKHPELESRYAQAKLNLLEPNDEDAWYSYAKKLAGGVWKGEAIQLNSLAWTIVDPKSKLKKRDMDIGLAFAQRAAELTHNQDPATLDTLAAAYFGKGNVDKAIELQEKASTMSDSPGASVPDSMKKDIKARLEEYKKKKAG